MILNELTQWAVLVVLGTFVLGLTRQLGRFLVPAEQQKTLEVGPDIGKGFSSDFLPAVERDLLRDAMASTGADQALFLVVSEHCPQCTALVTELAATERLPIPVAILSRESSSDHEAMLRTVADVVFVDDAKLAAARLTVGPLALLVDADLKVREKQLVWERRQLLDLFAEPAPVGPTPHHSDLSLLSIPGRAS